MPLLGHEQEPELAERADGEHLLREPGQTAEGVDGLHLAVDALRKWTEALVEQTEENLLEGARAFLETFPLAEPKAFLLPCRFLLFRPDERLNLVSRAPDAGALARPDRLSSLFPIAAGAREERWTTDDSNAEQALRTFFCQEGGPF
jgi:hypothetical protein